MENTTVKIGLTIDEICDITMTFASFKILWPELWERILEMPDSETRFYEFTSVELTRIIIAIDECLCWPFSRKGKRLRELSQSLGKIWKDKF